MKAKQTLQTGGVIYIMTNPSFPEYVKIGYADNVQTRLQQLNKSEVLPFAFRVYATYRVNQRLSDKTLHRLIDSLNPDLRTREDFNGKTRVREFYVMSAERAYELLYSIASLSGTLHNLHKTTPTGQEKQDEREAQKERNDSTRRSRISFKELGIPLGSTLTFAPNPEIQVRVIAEGRIEYDGEGTSLSALAQRLLKSKNPIQGSLYFKYEGELLTERRYRLERENGPLPKKKP